MHWLRQLLDKQAPRFAEGRLKKLRPLYEATDTFLFTPGIVTSGASHVRDGLDTKRLMGLVVLALAPCVFMACFNTGYQANLSYSQYTQSAQPELTQSQPDALLLSPDTAATPTSPPTAELDNSLSSGPAAISASKLLGWRYWIVGDPDESSFISNFLHGATYFLPIYLVCMAVGGCCEAIFAVIRGHEINEGFLVTGLLFPLTLPASIPLWQVAVGIIFGVVIGKEVFGGTGRNFLNPALTARAFLYFAYPAQISGDKVWNALGATDGISGATILGDVAASGNLDDGLQVLSSFNLSEHFIGFTLGSMGETSTLCCLIGAVLLIAMGIGSWRIMLSVLLGGLGTACLLKLLGGGNSAAMFAMGPLQHLVVGGFAFGLVFMATDPVSAALTTKGKYFYGTLIGVMAILIRVVNPAYPEGMMLAILFGNVFAPLIDYFVVQRNVGRRKQRWAAHNPVEGDS
ncbi:MAG: NADH:ubiquinone reductase (Na(+)-transporting) subunit B [Planctomycetaceae bacterium]|jgi:Na+-transporting NADH:ubiquinone oxidoreductase subunit B|nr:NADH:ubiquinone reductase (Na(+)-transporting) subunit B [Planctomycetaceae bacterium]